MMPTAITWTSWSRNPPVICCKQGVQDLAIVGDAADERADLVAIVIADAQGMELANELRSQLEREPDADLVRQHALDPVHESQQHSRARERQARRAQARPRSVPALGAVSPRARISSTKYC